MQRLVDGSPSHPSLQGRAYRLTVATLAREARVGRNTIYTNHRSILDELNRVDHQAAAPDRLAPEQKNADLIEQLQQQKQQLATENAALLKRAIDAEKTIARLEKQNAKLVHELDAASRPIALPRRRT